MRMGVTAAAVVAALLLANNVEAGGSHSSSSHRSTGSPHYSAGGSSHHGSSSRGHISGHGHAKGNASVKRDSHGHIARSEKAKGEFRRSHPCPSTGKTHGACPGYVIDHKQALKHGGADAASNMQWQTQAEATAKDRWE